jgi:hypothetical protein
MANDFEPSKWIGALGAIVPDGMLSTAVGAGVTATAFEAPTAHASAARTATHPERATEAIGPKTHSLRSDSRPVAF